MSKQMVRARARAAEADVSKQLFCFVLGGLVGAAAALLFAPKSGRELRGDIADVTRKGVDRTRETAGMARARAGEYYEAGRTRAGELAGSVRDAASRRGEQFTAAVEAGRRAYTEEKRRTETSAMEPAPTYYEGENG